MIGLLAGCAPSARPSFSEWSVPWDEAQRLVPTARQLLDDGRAHCDPLLVQLRTELDDLSPAPSESVDPALDAWSAHVLTLSFECPSDVTEIRERLATIHQLEAEIAAALP